MHKTTPGVISLFCFLCTAPVFAVDPPPEQHKHDAEPSEKISTTDGQVTVAGQVLKYKASAGHLLIKDDGGKPKAEMFFVSYEKQPVEEPLHRPITFVFNG